MNSPLSNSQINSIVNCVRACVPNVQAVYLFGSYAQDQATETSDVDIAFFAERPLDPNTTMELQILLSSQLKKDIDFIDLKCANTVLAMQIVSTGKVLYFSNKNSVDFFETTIYSMYANLNEERKEIIEDIVNRGSIYGR